MKTGKHHCLSFFGAVLAYALTTGAAAQTKVDHQFSFDARPNIEVLNYEYGDPARGGDHPPAWRLESGHISQGTGINGWISLGDYLYVKWRVLSEGTVFEDRVDLRERLPTDMTDQHIYFVIEGKQLNIYLISPEDAIRKFIPSQEELRRLMHTGRADDGVLAIYGNKKVTRIYPSTERSGTSLN